MRGREERWVCVCVQTQGQSDGEEECGIINCSKTAVEEKAPRVLGRYIYIMWKQRPESLGWTKKKHIKSKNSKKKTKKEKVQKRKKDVRGKRKKDEVKGSEHKGAAVRWR